MYSEQEILNRLKNNDVACYKQLFELHYRKLFGISLKYVSIKEVAEEIVQDIFIYLWDERNKVQINTSLESYLITSVKNKSINYLKSKYGSKDFVEVTDSQYISNELSADAELEISELKNIIRHAIKNLPPKCGIIYHLSRNAGMTYQQIADELNVGKETVKTQMGIALLKIREHLNKYWDHIPY